MIKNSNEEFLYESFTDYKDYKNELNDMRYKIKSGDYIADNLVLSETEFSSDKDVPKLIVSDKNYFYLWLFPENHDQIEHGFDYIEDSDNLYKHRDDGYKIICATFKKDNKFGLNIYIPKDPTEGIIGKKEDINRLEKYRFVTSITFSKKEKNIFGENVMIYVCLVFIILMLCIVRILRI